MQSTLPAVAPVDMVMPEGAQLLFNILNGILVVVVLGFALNYWRKQGSSIGIWLLLGGALTALNEPVVDVLGKAWFPAIGSWVLIKAWGVSIPTYMLQVYSWYVGGQAFIAYQLYRKGLTQKSMFVLYAVFALTNFLLEGSSLNGVQGMYSYYGNQPLVVFKFPLWWMFCNALMPMMIAGVVFKFDSVLTGLRRPLVILICWMTAGATNAFVAAPVWLALNVDGSTMLLTDLAAAVSGLMGLIVCYGLSLAVATDAATVNSPSSVAEPLRKPDFGRRSLKV